MRHHHNYLAVIMAGLIAMAPLVDATEDIYENLTYEDMVMAPLGSRKLLDPIGMRCFGRAVIAALELPYIWDKQLQAIAAWTVTEFCNLAATHCFEVP